MSNPETRALAARLLGSRWRSRTWVRSLARGIEWTARFGYLARGVVYVTLGTMALLAALELTPRAEGPVGALQAWAAWPLGLGLLWLLGLGLIAFAGWRGLQALSDADGVGSSPANLVKRAGKAASGVVSVAFGVSVFGLLIALRRAREVDDQDALQAAAGRILALPGGDLLLLFAGAGLIVAAAASFWEACAGHFTEDLDCDAKNAAIAGVLGRAGVGARAIGLLAVGALTSLAGWQARADQVRGLGGALEAMKGVPLGHPLLAALGAGFIAHGLFAFYKAAVRRIGC